MAQFHSAYRNPDSGESRFILVLDEPVPWAEAFVVVKLFPDPNRFSVKFWGGASLMETTSRWNTNEPYNPQPHEVSKALDIVGML